MLTCWLSFKGEHWVFKHMESQGKILEIASQLGKKTGMLIFIMSWNVIDFKANLK